MSLFLQTSFRLFRTTSFYSLRSFCAQNTSSTEDVDVLINGGGIVGLTFLLAAQKGILQGKKIQLIERQAAPKVTSSLEENQDREFSNRVSSITNSSKEAFEKLGIWDELYPFAKKVNKMHIWSFDFNKAIRFGQDDHNSVCYIVENDRILRALNRKLDHSKIMYNCLVQSIEAKQNLVSVQTSTGKVIRSKLLIGCDGYNSLVRQSSNFKQFELNLNQMGIVGTVKMDPNLINSHNTISYQRFVPSLNSVLALLPLDENYCSFVLSTTKSLCTELMQLDDESFVDYFNTLLCMEEKFDNGEIIRSIISQFDKLANLLLPTKVTAAKGYSLAPQVLQVQEKSRAAFPLGFGTTLPNLVSSLKGSPFINVALIGDSAHRVHPLAGQGLNLGIGDAVQLVNSLEEAVLRGDAIFGHPEDSLQAETLQSALTSFERARMAKLICMLSAIHSMQEIFRYSSPIMLHLFNQFTFVKKEMIKFANTN